MVEYIHRDYEGDVVEANSEEDLLNKLHERLEELASEAEKEGWVSGRYAEKVE